MMKILGNSVNVQSKLFNLTLFYGFPAFPFIHLTMWKEGLHLRSGVGGTQWDRCIRSLGDYFEGDGSQN
jgi:hypothetical protein